MVIDTSAIFAAIANEPDGAIYRNAIKASPVRLMSAITLLETRIVLFSRLGSGSIATFDELIVHAGIVVEPFDELLLFKGNGSIIFNGSVHNYLGQPGLAAYAARRAVLSPWRVPSPPTSPRATFA
jgi:hypothetical protein